MSFAVFCFIALSIFQRVHSHVLSPRGNDAPEPAAIGWYGGWHAKTGYPPTSIDWAKYNTVIYAFVLTTPTVSSLSMDGSDPNLLPQFVSEAHENGVSAHVSVGGWGGSLYFSSNVATSENRTAFVNTVVEFAEQNCIDGINFDWEYPGDQGIGCNIISPNDTQNFLLFLQELRANPVGAKLTVSATSSILPYHNASGKPSTDVSGFAEVLDYIHIMNYDVWGSWSSTVGPNAPLDDTCAPPAEQQGSAVSAVKAWTAAGMPVNQIVLGVAAYGHSFSVSPSEAFGNGPPSNGLVASPKFNASNQPLGDAWDDVGSVNVCGVFQKPGGTFTLWGLVDAKFLTEEGGPADGIYYRFDACSETPYVYNATSQVMVSFDNAASFAAKGKFIKDTGLKGFGLWEVGGDYNDILVDSIRLGAGFDC